MDQTFEVGHQILAIMHDTLFEVRDILNMWQNAFSIANIEDAVAQAHDNRDSEEYVLLHDDNAVVHFLFRNEHTRFHMVRIASRLLQKKLVCNRAGAFSAKQQRHDVTQEKNTTVTGLYHAVEDGEVRLRPARRSSSQTISWITLPTVPASISSAEHAHCKNRA